MSVGEGGAEGTDRADPSLSASGRYVVFTAHTGLLPGAAFFGWDVFVRDVRAGVTRRVAVARDGRPADDERSTPTISVDGRHVAFLSSATNLIRGDTNGAADIFVRTRACNSAR